MRKLELELQWSMVMELEKNINPLEDQLAKERNRLPMNQQRISKAEVRLTTIESPRNSWRLIVIIIIRPAVGSYSQIQAFKVRRSLLYTSFLPPTSQRWQSWMDCVRQWAGSWRRW